MLEKPDLDDRLIISRLNDEYGLRVAHVAFLPLGADVNTAAYHVVTEDETVYFLKLRGGVFHEASVAVPRFLKAHSVQSIIAPLETRHGHGWGSLQAYKMILYPFIQGSDGYEVALADRHWIDLGVSLKAIHAAQVPQALRRLIPQETYSGRWREMVRAFQAQVERTAFDEPVAAKLAAFMQDKRDEISHLVRRAEQLGRALPARSLEFVLCHSDIHAGNLHVEPGGSLYVVDWDEPIFAAKERDLMFVSLGMGSAWPGDREEALFYRGYGQTEVDQMALAYYRYERIVQDIAAFCQQLLATDEGGADREQSYRYFTSNFMPHHAIEVACRTDKWLAD